MTQNNNLSVLPWYTSIEEQNHRKSYAYGKVYPLYAQKDILLPFQIMRPTRAAAITSVKIHKKKSGTLIADITQKMLDAGLTIVAFPQYGYDVILFPANFPLSAGISEGERYLVMSDGVTTWYSDVLTLVSNISPYLKVEWWDVENLVFDAGIIVYQGGFKNRMYLSTELGKPEYTFNEEGTDRDGFFFPEKQVSEKTYKFSFLASEFLLDVIRFVRMSDYKVITDKYARVYYADTFLITPKWETQGDLASVETEFQTNTAVKKIGKGIAPNNGGDFNNSFNNDYKNQ